MIRNQAGQSIGAEILATNGTAFTGAVVVNVTIDRGLQAPGSVGGGACVLEGNGYYTYGPAQAETDGQLLAFTFTGAGAIPVTVQVFTVTAAQAAAGSTATVAGRATTGLALCRDAAIEIGHLDPIETLDAGNADYILRTLNRLLDDWNAERDAVYADVVTTFTLPAVPPVLGWHTIGPTGSLVLPARPVSIEGIAVLASGHPTRLTPSTAAWWFAQTPTTGTGTPSAFYYNPIWPNGELHLDPAPAAGVVLELLTRVVLTAVALVTTVTLPQGYESALMLTLAEQIAPALGIAVSPTTQLRAAQARARVQTNNRAPTPRLMTGGGGMPGGRTGAGYNYRTGGRF